MALVVHRHYSIVILFTMPRFFIKIIQFIINVKLICIWDHNTLLEKYPNLLCFCENPVAFNEARLHEANLNFHTHTWIFSPLSITSIDNKQHLSKVVLSSDFHCKVTDGFRVVSVHPGLVTCDYGVREVGVTVRGVQHVLWVLGGHAGFHKQWPRLHEHHNHWWRVLGIRVVLPMKIREH